MVISHTPNICRLEFVFGAHRVWIGEGGDFGRGDTVFWRPPCMNPGRWESEAVMSRLSEITNLPLSKPIEIEQIGFAWQGSVVVISISQILVSGGYCDFPRFVQILLSAHLPCQLNSNPVCILFFSGGIHFQLELHSIYIIFYIYFQKHNKEFCFFICIVWFTNTMISKF